MDEATPLGNDAESFGDKAGSSGKKERKKTVPSQAVENSPVDASSRPETSQPSKRSHSSASSHLGSSQPCKHSESPTSSFAVSDKTLDCELEEARLSAAARKRIKKFKGDQEPDLMLIEAKNAKILQGNPFKSSDLPEEMPTVEEEKIFHVTVTYLSNVAMFKCHENENFFKVFKDVGDFFNLKPTEFLLCLNDRNIVPSDTPKSISLSDLDILECIAYKSDLPSTSVLDEDSLTITFQSNDSKSKIDLVINRMEKMQAVMEQYAKKSKVLLNELKFKFKGQMILGTETPAELHLETGDCIDVMAFLPIPQCSHASDDQFSDDKQKAKNDYFSVYFQDFTFDDSDSVNPFKHSHLPEEMPTVEEEKLFHITVNYLSNVAMFKCHENENFFKVFKDVGDFFNLKPTEFLLCLNDRNIVPSDTPKSISLSDLDILECIAYKSDLPSTSVLDEDSLTITFQSNDSKSKIDLVINRMEKMQAVMEQYAKKCKVPLNELKFEFNGQILLGTETPAELHLETGDCIDVMAFPPIPQCSRASDDQFSDDKQSSKNDYFSVYFQDFTFTDSDSDASDAVAWD